MEFLSHFPHPIGMLLLRSENSKRLMQVIAPRMKFNKIFG